MKCPNCDHVSATALVKCGQCGEAFDRHTLEEFEHIQYLLKYLDGQGGFLGETTLNRLRQNAETRRTALDTTLRGQIKAQPLDADTARALALLLGVRNLIPNWIAANALSTGSALSLREHLAGKAAAIHHDPLLAALPPLLPSELHRFAQTNLYDWQKAGLITPAEYAALQTHLLPGEKPQPIAPPAPAIKPAPVLAAAPAPPVVLRVPATPTAPKPAPLPKAPPKPREPLIKWDKLWENVVEAAVSGLLLRSLGYFGAFVLIVSVAVAVISYWSDIPQWGQLGIVFFIPTVFYGGGLVLRRRFKITQTGGVLMGVGQILLAVDFAAIYQIGGESIQQMVPFDLYWLITSIICTLLYAFTLWRLVQDEFFGYIGLTGLASTLAAGVYLVTQRPEWPMVALAAVGIPFVELSHRMRRAPEKWREIAHSARRFPSYLVPLVLVIFLFVPGPVAQLARALAFGMATVGAGILAARFPKFWNTFIFVTLSAFTVGMTLWAVDLEWVWYGVVAAALSPLYMLAHRLLSRRLAEDFAQRRMHLLAFQLSAFGLLVLALGLGLVSLAVETGFWPGVIALGLAAILLGAYAPLFDQPLLVAVSGAAFVLPFSLAVWRWLTGVPQAAEWLTGAWMALAIVYLSGAAVLRKPADSPGGGTGGGTGEGTGGGTGGGTPPLRGGAYGRWLAALGLGMVPGALVILLTASLENDPYFGWASVAAIGGGLAFSLLANWMNMRGGHPALTGWLAWFPGGLRPAIFLYPVGALTPLLGAAAWGAGLLPADWLGAAISGLALGYVGLGQFLGRKNPQYRLPFHLFAYGLGALAALVALGSEAALMTALYMDVAVLAALAFVYRRPYETAAAGALALLPFGLMLQLLRLEPHAYSLAYVLLAGAAYVPLAWLLRRKAAAQNHHWPLWVTGYLVSGAAVLASLAGRFGLFPADVPWVGVAVPLLAAVLYAVSVYFAHPWFGWAAASVFPLAFGQALTLLGVLPEWDAVPWIGLAVVYLVLGKLLNAAITPAPASWKGETTAWRGPLNVGAWALAGLAVLLTVPVTLLFFIVSITTGGDLLLMWPQVIAQFGAIGFVILAAAIYRSKWPLFFQPWLAFLLVTLLFIGYGERMFGVALTSAQFGILWAALGLLHTAAAAGFDRWARWSRMHGVYLGGFLMATLAVFWTLADQISFLWALGLWIVLAAGTAVLVHFGRQRAWADVIAGLFGKKESTTRQVARGLFIWLAAWTVLIWLVVWLDHLQVVDGFQWLGLALTGAGLFALAIWLRKIERTYAWPLALAAHASMAVGLLISLPLTMRFLLGGYDLPAERLTALSFILLQWTGVALYAASAVVFRGNLMGYVFPWVGAALAFFPYTLGWITFGGDVIGRPLTSSEITFTWALLAAALAGAGVLLDQKRATEATRRWHKLAAHGPYAAGYAIADIGLIYALILWRPETQAALLWTLGAWVALMAASAWLVDAGMHNTWDDVVRAVFGGWENTTGRVVRGAFIWLAAWAFPVWLAVLLWQLGVVLSFGLLGYSMAAGGMLWLAVILRKRERTYAWPLLLAGQFYTLIALSQTLGVSLDLLGGRAAAASSLLFGWVLVQAAAVIYYAFSSWFYQHHKWIARGFSYAGAALAFVPYTFIFANYVFGYEFALGYAWIAFAAAMFGAGVLLDWLERRRLNVETLERSNVSTPKWVGFAHGVHLIGIVVGSYAVFWTWPNPLVHLYVLGVGIALAVLSHAAVHFGWHNTWDDFTGLFVKAGALTQGAVRTGFLWAAAIAFPVWLMVLLAHNEVPLEWRGLALALTAPLYVAFGLAARRTDEAYGWPLFITGYLLTAVGAMVSFADPLLAIYVLSLNVVVYAVSAYIFRQAAWLFLSTVLVPVISLMGVDYNLGGTPAPWVAGIFMGLGFLYFGVGRLFMGARGNGYRSSELGGTHGNAVSSFAAAFLGPGYLLSAVALAAASADRPLALVIYPLGVVLYALSAWLFRESVFLYPAVWLAAVPYYLGMTYTDLVPDWYGVGWLPLILVAIGAGRVFFHGKPLLLEEGKRGGGEEGGNQRLGLLAHLFTHPAMPFYSLAYALSLSMVFIARGDLTALAWALGLAGALYLGSAWLFRRAWWLYPGLLAAHLSILTAFAISPSGRPAAYLSLGFLPLTLLIGLLGAWQWKRSNRAWALPLVFFAAADVVLWQVVALFNPNTAIIVAGGHTLLLGVTAVMLVSQPLVWGSLGFLTLGLAVRLIAAELGWPVSGAVLAGIGFGLYLAARVVEELAGRRATPEGEAPRRTSLDLWGVPLTRLGIGINSLGALIPLGFILSHTTQAAAGLAFAGAMYLAVAYRGGYDRLGYGAVALLELAAALMFYQWEVPEPQLYAIPAGLYFTGVAWFERRRGRAGFARLLESFGLLVMLLVSFVQSLDAAAGLVYFIILLVEGLVMMGWGAQQRRKLPFVIGMGGSALNVAGQIVVLFQGDSTLAKWVIFGAVGLVLLLAAVFAERWIIPRARELRERLELWE